MADWFKIYYTLIFGMFIFSLLYYTLPHAKDRSYSEEHYIGVNLTKHGDNQCRVTWLGGWDFDSFYTNVSVNGVNVGHPHPMNVIYDDDCRNITVTMYDKAVHTDVKLYEYIHKGAP